MIEEIKDMFEEIPDEIVDVHITELLRVDRTGVDIKEKEKYHIVLFALESAVLIEWASHPKLKDRDVISAYGRLQDILKGRKTPAGGLAGRMERHLKKVIIGNALEGEYTVGELLSCLTALKRIARNHRARDRKGYLKWVKAFLGGRMPETEEEITEYIMRNEM